jgi:hypothetical protein
VPEFFIIGGAGHTDPRVTQRLLEHGHGVTLDRTSAGGTTTQPADADCG